MKKYQFAKDALAKFKAADGVETRTLREAICDILSLPAGPVASDEEMEIFGMLFCIMNFESNKWRSICQVALPYDQLIGKADPREDSLKSRVGLPAFDNSNQAVAKGLTGPTLQMKWRRHFLDLASMCIPIEERKRYPHLLTLVDSHVAGTDQPPSNHSSGVDAAAWCVANYLSAALQMERGKANQGFRVTVSTPLDVLEAHYHSTLERFQALIDEYLPVTVISKTPPSTDSLFSKLLVNAALNRHYLETQAFQKRLAELLGMQVEIFTEISETAPHGLDHAISETCRGSEIDYPAFVNLVLGRTIAEKGRTMTTGVLARIDKQADAVIASARGDHFVNEWQMNDFLVGYPRRAKGLLWIMLTWCYQHESRILNENPSVNKVENTVVSTRSKLILGSQDMSTLRRMLATPAFSLQWEEPSPRRLEMYARQNAAIRMLSQRKLAESLKGASLAQWEAAARQFIDWDKYCSNLRNAEVGTLMKEYAAPQPVPSPI